MKLPDNRNDRIKVLVLVAVGSIGVVYGVAFGLIRPLMARNQKLTDDMDRINRNLGSSAVLISRIETTRAENIAIANEVRDISARYLLKPRHGNYLIGATRYMEQCTDPDSGIQSINELGVSVLETREPSAGPDQPKKTFKSYTAEITAKCSMNALARLLNRVETGNPYLCVSKVQVTSDDRDPQRHRVTFRVQWPIWGDLEAEETLVAQAAEGAVEQ